jgi:hypothetical protein
MTWPNGQGVACNNIFRDDGDDVQHYKDLGIRAGLNMQDTK